MAIKKKQQEWKVILAWFAISLIWGSTYLVIRIGVSELPPELFMGIRFTLAGLILCFFAIIRKQNFPNLMDTLRTMLVGIFLLAGANGLVAYAEQWVHSSIAALILAGTPFFMAFLEMLIPDRTTLDVKGWFGLILGFSGVAILVLSEKTTGAIDLLGGGLILLASLFWSVGSIYSKSFTPSGSIISRSGIQMLSGGLGQCIVGLIMGEPQHFQLTTNGLVAMLYLLIFGSIVGFSCYVYVLSKWPASKAGTYTYVNPAVAIILGAVVLNETITIYKVIAMFIILVGVFLVQLSKYRGRAIKGSSLHKFDHH